MKKLILLGIISLVTIFAKTQDTTLLDRIYLLYEDYYDEYFNGNIPAAEKKLYRLSRASVLHESMLWAIGEGDSEMASSTLADLNAMFNTSYPLPTVNFDQTSQSYLDIDSIRLKDMTDYVSDVVDSLTVLAIIAANPSIDADSVNALIRASNDTLPLDSSWVEIDAPRIYSSRTGGEANILFSEISGSTGWNFNEFTGNGIQSATAFNIGNLTAQGRIVAGVPLGGSLGWRTNASTPTLMPYEGDLNTGFAWTSEDYIKLIVGDSTLMTFREQSTGVDITTNGNFQPDTITSYAYVDSSGVAKSYLPGLVSAPTDTTLIAIDQNGANIEFDIVNVTENSTATIYPASATPPDIPNNTVAYWTDSDNSKVYHIVDISGTQYYDDMADTP